ncbi:membrane protein [Methylopila jiangsuensis]|uniref:Membrane protein n=1 Tax=Methylopila jiangsuensis TaxID=586230 RepID=A0A9W6JID6_9HYPH|nr:DUF2232 domain-containing protein [Methylopila jiangsuensis]MDR6286879.1 hypothetical protein [Methylopila jiangsuensis]GLK76773.1 membrane protein [Methylopila jiangsuensis]
MTNAPLLLVGFCAGLASALLYASAASGSVLAIFLFYIAPLPILIAGIGWRHHAGLIGAVVAALALGVALGPTGGLFHAVAVGLPAWWLAYLALLARPGATESQTEWYPVGRLVLWTAVIGALLVTLSIPMVGTSLDEYRGALKALFGRVFETAPATPGLPEGEDRARLFDLMAALLPIMAALLWTVSSLVNLWLAGRITRASGRLIRPWPDLSAMTFPRTASYGFFAAMLGSFLPDLAGLVAELFATTLLVAFTLLGLAVVHVTTRAMPTRGLILFGVYALLLIQPWVGVFLAALGLAEQSIGVRKRFGGPPAAPTP